VQHYGILKLRVTHIIFSVAMLYNIGVQTTDQRFSSVRALIFDLDGTLIDSNLDLVHSVNAMLRELKRPELPQDTISSYIGNGAPVLVAKSLGQDVNSDELDRGLKFFLSYYEEHKMDNTCAYPGVAEALEHLSAMPMAVLTNKPVRISVRILEALGLAKYFRAVYGGNSFATKKPDPLGAQTILREFSLRPNEAVLVGDSEVDVQTARNAGMLAAIVNYGFGIHDRGAYPADIYLDRLIELVPALTAMHS
jgi:phosphoglycolate phosphatase